MFAGLPFDHHQLLTGLSAGWSAYIAVLAVWIVLQKRSPASTMGWILSMALLPIVGYGIYYFFGPRRFKKQRLKRIRSQARLSAKADLARLSQTAADAPPHLQQIARLGRASCDLPVSSATAVELLRGGAQTFDAIFAAVRAAQDHVHLEYYIFEPDRIGTALRDVLVSKAIEGVTVRLLVDSLGSKRLGARFFKPLEDAGAHVALFHPSRIGRRWRPVTNFRTHRKIVVCDGLVGFTGGVNITDEEDVRIDPEAYHDVHLRIDGAAVRWLQMTFLEDWAYATGERATAVLGDTARLLPLAEPGPHAVQIITSGPDNPMEAIHRVQVAAINAAATRVWLTTPYFVPGEPSLMALTSAALRGVEVRVLVPQRSDSLVVSAAARSYFDELIAVGVQVYEYKARMLHSKTLLVDDDCAFVGTANFDNRSFRLNYEVCALVYGPLLATALEDQFHRDLLSSMRVPAHREPPFLRRLGEAAARLFSPVL